MNISFQFLEWGCDDLTIYYSRPDEQNQPFAVLMHKTCQSVLTDVVLHEEKDERLVKIIFIGQFCSNSPDKVEYIYGK